MQRFRLTERITVRWIPSTAAHHLIMYPFIFFRKHACSLHCSIMAFIQPCSTSVLLRRCRVPLTISLPHPPYQVVRTRSIPRACTLPPKPPSSIAPPSSSPSPSPSSPSSSSSSPPPTTGLVQSTTDLDPRVLFSEFLATFLFVNISLTAAASSAPPVYNAATIASLVASFITVSGAHINPAITLCLLVTNRVSLPRAAAFVPLQLLASVLAAVSVRAVGIPLYPPVIPSVAALPAACVREFLPMFFVAVIVFQTAVATEKEGGVGNKLAAFYIGLAVLACAGTFSTSVFNPARAFGPALVAGALTHHWVFWLPPMLGATIAAFVRYTCFLFPVSLSAFTTKHHSHVCMILTTERCVSIYFWLRPPIESPIHGWLCSFARPCTWESALKI